ncbi:TIGR00730 family Rossman fold protein [bacterium]|nr:TIGR00730 family Rossman fold protein [bacterium]|tara:strand:- start:843 stop:1574 length:732 start_codon:yes stop_codon:yes gene_type:complete
MFAKKSSKKSKGADSSGTCRVVTDLLGADGDAIESWRIFRIMAEFVEGFEALRLLGKAVTIFGGSRIKPNDPYYKMAEELAYKLAKKDFAVITGGGPGIMEAANVGAFKAGGKSIGLNIELPFEQHPNAYTTDTLEFDFFFSRKVMLAFASEVYIFMPGGFGTMDEFFEIVTLVQTKKIEPIPVVLIGNDFWEPILQNIKINMVDKFGTVSKEAMEIVHLVDSVDDAYEYIIASTKNRCGIQY